VFPVYVVRFLRANTAARAAQLTPLAHKDQFGLRFSRFGAVAPLAGQWAPLEIHRHTDARTIVDRERIEVENQPL
jgi:hypothetical protein